MKTFPANDEAFARFYANNTWGVTKYEDLSLAQKKLLLYNSMLDNAILVELLSNVSQGSTSVASGIAMKHQTGANVIDSVSYFYGAVDLPKNNKYWDWYNDHGINLVMDGTRPMMVHFTAEQMTANDISTTGANSDFAIITGEEYNDSVTTAYIFRDRIIRPDVTCQNASRRRFRRSCNHPMTLSATSQGKQVGLEVGSQSLLLRPWPFDNRCTF